jgi:hypothetical protein
MPLLGPRLMTSVTVPIRIGVFSVPFVDRLDIGWNPGGIFNTRGSSLSGLASMRSLSLNTISSGLSCRMKSSGSEVVVAFNANASADDIVV